jgi:host factor-I protein
VFESMVRMRGPKLACKCSNSFETQTRRQITRKLCLPWRHAPRKTHLSFECPQKTQEPLQVQDAFLDAARAQATRVAMFLVNGIRLVGCVELFDQHTVLLSSATEVQLVYKHAISTVQPDTERARPVRNADSLSEALHDRDANQPVVVARKRRFPTTVDGE